MINMKKANYLPTVANYPLLLSSVEELEDAINSFKNKLVRICENEI